jgi:hypothetical protein
MIAYIAELNKLIAPRSPSPQPSSLRQRFLDWYRSLPEFARNRRFAMSEIEVALKTQCKPSVLCSWSWDGNVREFGAPLGNITDTGFLLCIRISIFFS